MLLPKKIYPQCSCLDRNDPQEKEQAKKKDKVQDLQGVQSDQNAVTNVKHVSGIMSMMGFSRHFELLSYSTYSVLTAVLCWGN